LQALPAKMNHFPLFLHERSECKSQYHYFCRTTAYFNITVQIQIEVEKTLNYGSLRSQKKKRVVHFFGRSPKK
jgi:hypothetical protein